jgi:hypothetical protein
MYIELGKGSHRVRDARAKVQRWLDWLDWVLSNMRWGERRGGFERAMT